MTVRDRILMRALKANKTIKIDSIPQGTRAEYANSGRIFPLEFYLFIFFRFQYAFNNSFLQAKR